MSDKSKQLQAIFGDSSDSESDEDLFKSLNAGGSDDDDSSSSSSDDSSSEDEVERRPKKQKRFRRTAVVKRKPAKNISHKNKVGIAGRVTVGMNTIVGRKSRKPKRTVILSIWTTTTRTL